MYNIASWFDYGATIYKLWRRNNTILGTNLKFRRYIFMLQIFIYYSIQLHVLYNAFKAYSILNVYTIMAPCNLWHIR